MCVFFFFFFKQKTAYEMRISDWSSDVCSSDLWLQLVNELDMFFFSWFYVLSVIVFVSKRQDRAWYRGIATFIAGLMTYAISFYLIWEMLTYRQTGAHLASEIGRAKCRDSVCQYVAISVLAVSLRKKKQQIDQ